MVYNELCRYEVSLQMRDEAETQTDLKQYSSKQINTEINKKSLEIKNIESSDEELRPEISTSNLLMSRHSRSIEELKNNEANKKIMTTPQSSQNLNKIKSDNRIFSAVVHGGNKKNTIFSLTKDQKFDDDTCKLRESRKMLNEYKSIKTEENKAPLQSAPPPEESKLNEDSDDSPLRSSDDLEEDEQIEETEHKEIHEIFKNSEIIDKSNKSNKSRYFESEGEDEYDFYDDSEGSPQINEKRDQAIGCSPPRMTDESSHSEEDEHMIDVNVVIPQQKNEHDQKRKEESKEDPFRNQIIDIKTNNTPVEEIEDQNEINDNDSDEEEQIQAEVKINQNEEELKDKQDSDQDEDNNEKGGLGADHNYFGTNPEGEGMFEDEYDDENAMSPEEVQATRAEFGNMTEEEQQFYLQLLAGEKSKRSRTDYNGEGDDEFDPTMMHQHDRIVRELEMQLRMRYGNFENNPDALLRASEGSNDYNQDYDDPDYNIIYEGEGEYDDEEYDDNQDEVDPDMMQHSSGKQDRRNSLIS